MCVCVCVCIGKLAVGEQGRTKMDPLQMTLLHFVPLSGSTHWPH